MDWTDYEKLLLPLMMWREARGEGRDGMRAVGHVAWNRHQRGRPLWQVITDDAQFTSINPPGKTSDPQLDVWPREKDPRFAEALQLASDIMSGKDPDPTGGATYYWNPKASDEESWFSRNIAPQDEPTIPRPGYQVALVQGQHIFYRSVRSV